MERGLMFNPGDLTRRWGAGRKGYTPQGKEGPDANSGPS